jgi:hypothetical protein
MLIINYLYLIVIFSPFLIRIYLLKKCFLFVFVKKTRLSPKNGDNIMYLQKNKNIRRFIFKK